MGAEKCEQKQGENSKFYFDLYGIINIFAGMLC